MLLFFLLLITLLNIALGCYAAIELGYGPPSLKETLALLGDWRELRGLWGNLGEYRNLLQRLIPKRGREKQADAVEETQAPPLDLEEMLRSVSEANVADLLEDDAEDIAMVAPLQELFDDDLVSALMEKGTEAWLMGEKHVETSILKLNVVMMKSGKFSADLDSRLRRSVGTADAPFVKRCMAELRDDCKNYLESQASMTGQIQKRIDEFGELAYLAEDIDYANMEQSAQIETTISNIDQLSPANPEEAVQKLLKELSKLRVARHRLRDQQEKAFLTVVRYEERLDTIPHQLYIDEATGLRGRIGLEVTLVDWWKQKRQENRQLCFALIDLAKFGEVNDEQGITVGDKVIKYFGGILEKDFTSQDISGIYYGNCFLVVTVNMGLRKTVSEIEKIRQSLERTTFTYQEEAGKFSLEVTCGVTEALPDQSEKDVCKALESTLAAAKKAGRNHTFLLEQDKLNPAPEKVASPNLGSEYLTIDLDTIS